MSVTNTSSHYGSAAKFFHWLIALAIITMIPLGIIANDAPFDTTEALARKVFLFSLHKTLGVLIFWVALARIIWAVIQPKPATLHPDRVGERFVAATVHWLLYASLVLVPLTGWASHAATQGFAPIWWPFGQSLPFVSKSESVAATFAALHIIFERVLIVAVLLHLLGALKHHFIDRDATLLRMLPGKPKLPEIAPHKASHAPLLAAIGVYCVALITGAGLGLFSTHAQSSNAPGLAVVQSDWTVDEGHIEIQVFELGSETKGEFAEWTAQIAYAETPVDGVYGDVSVTVALNSLTLGSVTDVAIGPEFFDVNVFPNAVFSGPILTGVDGLYVDGTLTIRDIAVPVALPFELSIEGNEARMRANTVVNRLDFDVGTTYTDPEQVGFDVSLNIALSATRQSK